MGLIFRIESLALPIASHTDGIQAGLGLKYWLFDELALRGLVFVNLFSDPEDDTNNTSNWGIGLAGEYHFIIRRGISVFRGL